MTVVSVSNSTCHFTEAYWYFTSKMSTEITCMACEYYKMRRSVTDGKNVLLRMLLYSAGLVGYRSSIFEGSSSNHMSHQVTHMASSVHCGQQLSHQGASMQQTHYTRVSTVVYATKHLCPLSFLLVASCFCHLLSRWFHVWLILWPGDTFLWNSQRTTHHYIQKDRELFIIVIVEASSPALFM
jgi:hypothetical protein